MKALVTGGAGFIGRWVVERLLRRGSMVWVLDNLSNGSLENLEEFAGDRNLCEVVIGDILDQPTIRALFESHFDVCLHLAASISVQDSIDNPRQTFENDVAGTFNLLEEARRCGTKVVYASTCLVYEAAADKAAIDEEHPVRGISPYAGAKLAGEKLVQSYYHAYGLPVVIARPFNTYGPFQKSSSEGGVVATFLGWKFQGKDLCIHGSGSQTRDFLYVTDCADFLVEAAMSHAADGEVLNAGTGRDVSIDELALLICQDVNRVVHIPHPHLQSEIGRLIADSRKAKGLLGWEAKVSLEEGLRKTEEWLEGHEGSDYGGERSPGEQLG